MWEFFIKNDKFSYLLLFSLLGVGFFSVLSISKEASPEVQVPVGIVTTILPGAPAADIETLITNEIERGLKGSLENVTKINSISKESISTVIVEFDASEDVDASITQLKDEIDKIKADLPTDAEDPFVSEVNFIDQPILTIAVSGDRSDFAFVQLARGFENDIESIPGISRVDSEGVRKREISVIVDQAALIQYNIGLSQVTNAIRLDNQSLPVGKIQNGKVLYNIAFEGDIKTSIQLESIAVTTRNGQPVYVRDIATVVDGLTKASTLSRLSLNNNPSEQAVSFKVYKQRGGDIITITNAVSERLAELQETGALLENLQVNVVLNAGDDIKESLNRLTFSGMQTVFLVVLILIFAIGWREGLIAGLSIPLAFLFGFIGLYLSGNTINFLSLFALILGIGVLVDSGIVMVEGINRRMKDSPTTDKTQAALLTIREFSSPIIAGTLTTVSMFSGLFIVSGVTGQFIAVIPFTLIFVLFASLLVALGILPLIASTFLRRRSVSKLEQKQVFYAHRLETWYRNKLEFVIGNKRNERIFLWTIRVALVLALMLPVGGVVKVVFFEQSDVDYIIVETELPEGSILETSDIAIRRIEEILYTQSNISSFLTTVGAGNEFVSATENEKMANVFITLRDDRTKISSDILEEIRTAMKPINDISVTVSQPTDGPPAGAPVSVKFKGENQTELNEIANQAAEILKDIEGSSNVRTSANNNSTEFVITLNKAKTAAYGLNPVSVSSVLRASVYGTDATSITSLDDSVDVIVRLNATLLDKPSPDELNQLSIDALTRISLPTPNGNSVLLSSLVDVSLRESSESISHEDGERVISVSADITSKGNAQEIQSELLKRIENELSISESVTVSSGGETGESNKAFIELFLALVVGIVLMLAVLVLQFNSYLHTRYVLSILPYSLIGIMVGLAVTGNSLSFPSIMGFIALSGIVVNNSILLIDMMNTQRIKHPDKKIQDVVVDSAVNRLRPILLTTITTVIGMIPLTYADDLWAPLAYAVMFGLLFSVVITLVLVPIIYNRNPGKIGVFKQTVE